MQNPEGPHAGDMMNFTVDAKGIAKTTVTNKNVTMGARRQFDLRHRARDSRQGR